MQSIPQAPGAWPLLGHVPALARDPFTFLLSLREHASAGLVRIQLGTLPVYVATTTETVTQVLVQKARSFEKGRFFDRLRALAGNGLANADNATHRKSRRLMTPMFSNQRIATSYARMMLANARAQAAAWKPGQELDVHREMAQYAIATVARSLFSSVTPEVLDLVQRHLPIALDKLLKRAASPKLLDRLPVRHNRQFDAAVAQLNAVIERIISDRRRAGQTDQHDDLLGLLLATGMEDVQIRDEASTLFYSGAETTGAILAWLWMYLARHPEVQDQVVAQIQETLGDREMTIADVPRLTALRRALDEVIRLHGVTFLMRRTTEPVEIGGVELPQGAEVGFSLYALHRDPALYGDDAAQYNPDRWLPERQEQSGRLPFLSFGAGAHKCIGEAFAYTEATIAMATWLRDWKLVAEPGHAPKQVPSAVSRPDRMPMTVQPRHP
ncbi:cytochrome P450 [Streptomyces sp. Ru73]|uniref:cytochrome P450 n=1 Tax=Streptomyces sp. Ru73 TaxID=2080748 RepID=UPI0021566A5C|nr:cytochrome P450 [Streptomyces sp. Ru73]